MIRNNGGSGGLNRHNYNITYLQLGEASGGDLPPKETIHIKLKTYTKLHKSPLTYADMSITHSGGEGTGDRGEGIQVSLSSLLVHSMPQLT